jgi:hypothetical protein
MNGKWVDKPYNGSIDLSTPTVYWKTMLAIKPHDPNCAGELQLFPAGTATHTGRYLNQLPPGTQFDATWLKDSSICLDSQVAIHAHCTNKTCSFSQLFSIGPGCSNKPSLQHQCDLDFGFGIKNARYTESDVQFRISDAPSMTWPSSLPTTSHANLQQWFDVKDIKACNVLVAHEYMFGTLQNDDFWSILAPGNVQEIFDSHTQLLSIRPI